MDNIGRNSGNNAPVNPFFPPGYVLLLGSRSPRRAEILAKTDIPFKTVDIDFDENASGLKDPVDLARAKSRAYAEPLRPHEILLTADTVVRLDGEILGKPADREEARKMLERLSGRVHEVESGVCLRSPADEICFSEITRVRFRLLSPKEISYYLRHYRPWDKAGAYGIQEWIGLAAVCGLEGDYYNVMGLPACRTLLELQRLIPGTIK